MIAIPRYGVILLLTFGILGLVGIGIAVGVLLSNDDVATPSLQTVAPVAVLEAASPSPEPTSTPTVIGAVPTPTPPPPAPLPTPTHGGVPLPTPRATPRPTPIGGDTVRGAYADCFVTTAGLLNDQLASKQRFVLTNDGVLEVRWALPNNALNWFGPDIGAACAHLAPTVPTDDEYPASACAVGNVAYLYRRYDWNEPTGFRRAVALMYVAHVCHDRFFNP